MTTIYTIKRELLVLICLVFFSFMSFCQGSDAAYNLSYKFKVTNVSSPSLAEPVLDKLNELLYITHSSFSDDTDYFHITTNAPLLPFYIDTPLNEIGYTSETLLTEDGGPVPNK